jgi:hypothetical protein
MQRKLLLNIIILLFIISSLVSINSWADDAVISMPPVFDSEELSQQNTETTPIDAAKKAKEKTETDAKKTPEQSLYESELHLNVIKYGFLKEDWPLKFPRQALKDKKIFDKNESDILSVSTRTLLSLNAPLSEEDFPEMYDLWARNIDLIDEAESAGLYTPPADLANALGAWRMKKQIDKATLEAAWILSPSVVEIDANVSPINIPTGFKFLSKAELHNLENKIVDIKRIAVEKNKLKFPLRAPDETISNLIAPIDTKQKWSASITVISNRLVDFDGAFINDEMANSAALINTIQSRLDPVSNMRFGPDTMGSYNKNLVKWLVVPKRDVQNDSMQYAMTDGAATKALGIEYAFLKLGKNQQIALTINHLKVAQSLAYADHVPPGKKQADYLPENVLNPVKQSLQPILDSIQFKTGFQLKDATEVDKKMQVSLSSLIEGQPTIMEQGVKRIMAEHERKSNFWLFLKDNPRYQGLLFAALGAFLAAFSKPYNAKLPSSFAVKFPLISSFIIILLPIIMIASIVYINFFAE